MVEDTPKISLDVNDIVSGATEVTPDTVEADTTAEASSTPEDNAEVQTTDEEPSEGKDTEGDTTDTEDADQSDEDAVDTDETQNDEPKNKSAQGRIRNLIQENRELKTLVETKNREVYKPQTAQEIYDQAVEQGQEISPSDARVAALEARQQLNEFNSQVAEVTTALESEARQVMTDFPEFDPESPQFNEEISTIANAVYQKAAGIKTDPKTGLMYEAAVFPYEVYQAIHQSYSAGTSTSQVKAQRSAEKMLAAVDAPSSAAPKEPKETSFLKGFDAKYRK